MILACGLLPLCGYIIGYVSGYTILRLHRPAITISLETGFQNLALSLLMLSISLPSPESDMAGVIPICYTFANTIYSVLMAAALLVYRLSSNQNDATTDHVTYAQNDALELEDHEISVITETNTQEDERDLKQGEK